MKRKLLFTILTLLITGNIFGQLTIEGQFRTRNELRDGYRILASDQTYPNMLVSQRSRILLDFNDDNFAFRFSAQDARVWGQNWTAMHNNTIHIHEVWAAYKFNHNLILKLGRQELKYDDQRIMAAKNFSITGVTYDAAVMAYHNKDNALTLHMGSMVNNVSNTSLFMDHYPPSFKYMTFLWGEKIVSDMLKFNALNFLDFTQNPGKPQVMFSRNTVGANIIFKTSAAFGGRIGGYLQFGETWLDIMGIDNSDVFAYSYNAAAWLKPFEAFTVSLNIDTYSGQDWTKDVGAFTGFNRLLNAGHGHLGFMDYFTSAELQEVRWAGLHDIFLRAGYNINQNLSLQATVHYFMLHKPFFPAINTDGYIEVNRNLATEIDFVAKYKVNDIFSLEIAFMTMLPEKSLKYIKLIAGESRFSYYSYISLLFTPRFFHWHKTENDL